MEIRRMLMVAVCVVVAVPAALIAYGSLSNLWADYQDSPTSTYLIVGLPALALAVAAILAVFQEVRRLTRAKSK